MGQSSRTCVTRSEKVYVKGSSVYYCMQEGQHMWTLGYIGCRSKPIACSLVPSCAGGCIYAYSTCVHARSTGACCVARSVEEHRVRHVARPSMLDYITENIPTLCCLSITESAPVHSLLTQQVLHTLICSRLISSVARARLNNSYSTLKSPVWVCSSELELQ